MDSVSMTGIERIAAEVIAALFLVWGTVLYLEHRGAAACVAADRAAVAKQEGRNEAKAASDTQEINQEAKAYHDAITAVPDPTPALVCVRRITVAAMPPARAAQPVRDGAPDHPKTDQPPAGDDPGPDLAKIGQAADAQIVELQDYVRDVCRPR